MYAIKDREYGMYLVRDKQNDYLWSTNVNDAMRFETESEAKDRFSKMDSSQGGRYVSIVKI